MKTEDILNLDYRDEKSKEIIQKALKKIKPLSKFEKDVPLEMIEKLVGKLTRKYNVQMQYIIPVCMEDGRDIFSGSLKKADKSGEWLGNVYGYGLYELMAKTAIKMYALTKSGEIKERE